MHDWCGHATSRDFDPVGDARTYVSQSINGILTKLRRWSSSSKEQVEFFTHSLPAFGQPMGFAVNYSCDFTVRFDLEGTHLRSCQGPIALDKLRFLLRESRSLRTRC